MIYFDNAATTKVDDSVLSSYVEVSKKLFGNPSSLHELGDLTTGLLRQSRKQIASLLNVKDEEIIFTSGGTEGDNWAIKGTAFEKMAFGKHMITSSIEHPAVLRTMEQLEGMGWKVTYLPIDNEGRVRPEDVKDAITDETVLVSIMAINNETGSIQPLEEIGKVLEDYPAIHFHVDAVQSVGLLDLNLSQSRIDFAVYSGHKFNAPKGTGFMYIKKGRKIKPLLNGGGQETGQRSGTENVPGNVALAKAFRLAVTQSEEKKKRLAEVKESIQSFLETKEKVTFFSPSESSPHILCFGIQNIRGEIVVHALEKEGIFVSTTSACSSKRKEKSESITGMGYAKKEAETAVRISLGIQNTLQEAKRFKVVFDDMYSQLKNIQ